MSPEPYLLIKFGIEAYIPKLCAESSETRHRDKKLCIKYIEYILMQLIHSASLVCSPIFTRNIYDFPGNGLYDFAAAFERSCLT